MTQDTSFHDPFDFVKKLWGPMGLPLAGMVPPLLDPQEIDKRIADLRNVEAWLGMNLNVLRMTIQSLEMQRATISAFQSMQAPAAKSEAATSPAASAAALQQSMSSAAEAWWNMLQQQAEPLKGKAEQKPK